MKKVDLVQPYYDDYVIRKAHGLATNIIYDDYHYLYLKKGSNGDGNVFTLVDPIIEDGVMAYSLAKPHYTESCNLLKNNNTLFVPSIEETDIKVKVNKDIEDATFVLVNEETYLNFVEPIEIMANELFLELSKYGNFNKSKFIDLIKRGTNL